MQRIWSGSAVQTVPGTFDDQKKFSDYPTTWGYEFHIDHTG
jgi:hypothetical protein